MLLYSSEDVKQYLDEYFTKSHKALKIKSEAEIDVNLCLLCIQCFEVIVKLNVYNACSYNISES